ncbi:N-6 DNA methylase, partial [bacterium]|nr:N-6 DNA methylase [bacterium]
VFEKGGFDIVIANPPYVRVHKQNKEQKEVLKRVFTSPHKDFDIYIVFIEQAMRLLKENGVLCFITPDKYLIREYGEKIRKYLFNYQLVEFYDVSRANDLFGAAVYPLITIVKKKHEKGK